ncbi:hypothetical protein BDS110ZK23_56610 [Bradyrhizobium diazoefficiens]|uniref:Uncharacterized protein n=1 Tax=Bradyrhizobium diazoefficiens TaxID=1355477 RepID=A0A810BSG6_9BRAD|nr:hypothetical protein XF9B_13570 [Bradyrhizobium diazoefficiens]BCE97336.1 hypothetical protein XF11B_13570 [Bradyrhizobium diazoefficiens]BCF05989.1 hypothetical protein XF12B_13620 [Bradyrhizobium diazoefficiens]BCF58406.1 hypothetical protein XF18B_13540 [Bradyrhizobium diazoefficiens]
MEFEAESSENLKDKIGLCDLVAQIRIRPEMFDKHWRVADDEVPPADRKAF